MGIGVSRRLPLLVGLGLIVYLGLWQVDSVRESLRAQAAAARETAPPEPPPSPGSFEDDLWDVYPVVLDLGQGVLIVPAEYVLLPAVPLEDRAQTRRIFHVPVL